MTVDPAAFAAAGLYDASAPDAASRLALLDWLAELGCSIEEMRAADARGRLFALAGDRLIRPGRDRWSLAQVAERLDADVDDVTAVWRALGLVMAPGGTAVASDADVEAVRTVLSLAELTGLPAAIGVARVMASALSRSADAVSTVVRSRVPELAIEVTGDELATARAFAGVAANVPAVGRLLDSVFRHHLEAARRHFEMVGSYDLTATGGMRLAVGFADLSNFTQMSAQLGLDDLSSLLTRFEEVACDVIADHDARLVKFIGDAVMWVAATPSVATGVAAELVEQARRHGTTGRAGVTSGVVLALDGDYFGPVVNLAARLVALAAPGEILLDGPTAAALGDGLPGLGPIGAPAPRVVRGFADPVPVARLSTVRSDAGR